MSTRLGKMEIAECGGNADWSDIVLTLDGGSRITLEDLINRFAEKVERIAELETGVRKFLAGDYPNPAKYRPDKCPHGYWVACERCNDEYFEALLKGKDD